MEQAIQPLWGRAREPNKSDVNNTSIAVITIGLPPVTSFVPCLRSDFYGVQTEDGVQNVTPSLGGHGCAARECWFRSFSFLVSFCSRLIFSSATDQPELCFAV